MHLALAFYFFKNYQVSYLYPHLHPLLNPETHLCFIAGESPDKVYSIALCSKDVSLTECHSCINVSTYDVLGACPNQKEAKIWANKCSLQYSPRSIFNREEDNPMRGLYNTGNVPDVEGFNNVLLSRGGGMYMAPQNFEIFLNIYTIILIFSKFSLQK